MKAAWLFFEAGGMAWFDGGRVFAWRDDETWFGVYAEEWKGAEIPGTAPEGKFVPQRGLGHVWQENNLKVKVGFAVRPAEQGGDGDYEVVEGGFHLRLGSEVYHLVDRPLEPEPEPPAPPPAPGPGPGEGSALLDALYAIKDLLQLVALRIGWGGDWVRLPVTKIKINLARICFFHPGGRVDYPCLNALALPEKDWRYIDQQIEARLRERCGDGDKDGDEVDLAAKGRRERAQRR